MKHAINTNEVLPAAEHKTSSLNSCGKSKIVTSCNVKLAVDLMIETQKRESFLVKRKAILIGNTHGLNGVSIDIDKTRAFLGSPTGGDWFPTEIEVFENPRKDKLLSQLEVLRRQSFDYVFVLFSGHGAQERQTILELNADGETILESQLHGIATRQLTIFDCCRVVTQQVRKSLMLESVSASFSESLDVRRRYDARIMQAIPQQARLYACAVGQCSYDTPNGAVYLSHFLDAARSMESASMYKTIEAAHADARTKTIKDKGAETQTPDAILPKCLTNQQLIISMRA